jgi:hypothetical protein
MNRKLLLSSAALALVLGFVPATAQESSKAKSDHATTEQRDRTAPPQRAQKADSSDKRDDRRDGTVQRSQNTEGARSGEEKAGRSADSSESKERAETRTNGKESADTRTNDSGKSATSETGKAKDADVSRRSSHSKPADDNKKESNSSSDSATKKSERTGSAKGVGQNESSRTNERSATKAGESNRESTKASSDKMKAEVSASLEPEKKRELHSAVAKLDVKPVTDVSFSVSVGTVVPRTVSLRPLPSTIVEIVPQYRGYDFFVVRDEVVIVEPHTHKIVDVIERSAPSHARAGTTTRQHPKLSARQREIIRKRASSRNTAATVGSSRTRTEIVVGETVPDTVEVESFPAEVYREVPEIRTYRYINRGGDIYLVDPSSRLVIEEIR